MKCLICDDEDRGTVWTDRHGLGACIKCNVPYWIEGFNGKTETEIDILPAFIPIFRRYWSETKHRLCPGSGMLGSLGAATAEDVKAWNEWMVAHRAELDAIKATVEPAQFSTP